MQFRLSLLRQSATFWLVLALFVIGNAWTVLRYTLESWCCGDKTVFGFPFPFYIADNVNGQQEILYLGFLLDLVLPVTLATLAARIALLFRSSG